MNGFWMLYMFKVKNEYHTITVSLDVAQEAVVRRCSSKLMLLKILQTAQENTCAGASF